MTIYQVSAGEALQNWAFYEKKIKRVLARADSGCTPEDVLTCVQLGSMQLWRDAECKAVGVTEIQTFPLFKVLLVFMVAGEDVRTWLQDGQRQFDSFAKQSGCKYVEFLGRPGWERMLDGFGYGRKMVRMRKEL